MTLRDDSLHEKVITTGLAAKFASWNFIGSILPMFVALVAIPLLLDGLGKERFGLLMLIWLLVGYFGFLDFGLGRALTKMTAEWLGKGRSDELPRLFWTSVLIMVGMGCAGALIIAGMAPRLVYSILKITPELQPEALHSFYVVCLGLPVVVLTVGLVGVLEAHHRFGIINLVRVPMGTYIFLGPLCVLPFTNNLVPVVSVLIAGRVVECMIYFVSYVRIRPGILSGFTFERSLVRPLLIYGSWMTVSTLIFQFMMQVNRFFIGIWLSVAVVAFYSIPSEMVVKLLIIPRSWVSVLFPSFAARHENDLEEVSALFGRGVKFLLLGMFPLVLLIMVFAYEGLGLWLDIEMAQNSAVILQWLTYGMFICGLTYVPYLFLQGVGRPDIPACIHLIECPFFCAAAYVLIQRFGTVGAAYAFMGRALLDLALMYGFAGRFIRGMKGIIVRNGLTLVLQTAVLLGALAIESLIARIIYCVVFLMLYPPLVWFVLLAREERKLPGFICREIPRT